MPEVVVDTNVWATAGKTITEVETLEEADCIEHCADWIVEFLDGGYKLLVDSLGKVIEEYNYYILPGRFPESELNRLYSELWGRLEYVDIEFDNSGSAVLPAAISFHDPADRKFVALALARDPYAPIYNAADTDWAKEREKLAEHGLTIYEICPDYIEQKRASR
ncbi:MAG: hypothetical protein OXI30_00080 [Chloroflexota bacterium]|nr:hypothetical protein [Chloroflexota bacterium]